MPEAIREKIAPSIIALLLLSGIFMLMYTTQLPQKNISDIYRKFDESVFEPFKAHEFKKKPVEEDQPRVEAEKEIPAPDKPVPREPTPNQVIEKLKKRPEIDLSKLMQKKNKSLTREKEQRPTLDLNTQRSLNRKRFSGLDRLERGRSNLPVAEKKDGPIRGVIIDSRNLNGGDPDVVIYSDRDSRITSVKKTEQPNLEITLSERRMRPDAEMRSQMYRDLIVYMKKNPVELSFIMKRFLEYSTGALTTQATFAVENRVFELNIMCLEKGYEVRVALIEGDKVTRLVDQGFTKESDQIRIGTVSRNQQGEIDWFDSTLKKTGSEENQEFYAIFYAWWERVKDEN